MILKEHRYAKLVSTLVYTYPRFRTFLFKHYGQKLSDKITDIFSGEKI